MRSFARGRSAVQQEVVEQVARAVESIFLEAPENWTVASAEKAVWTLILDVGRDILGALLAEASRARSEAYATARYHPDEWRFRLDERSDAVVATTLGVVTFPWFAIRFLAPGGKEKTCNPAQRALMPYYRRARSSPALLKWECALGSREPFRRAEVSLTRFTNGAVTLEDTTIARHTVAIGKSIDRSWLYRDRDDIHRVVLERATRCRKTGRPLVYVSSDAHAVRRYVDDTWAAEWKMLNGIRVWCVDRDSGDLIHVGGEYTWGDCREVAASLKGAMDAGYLPPDGDFGGATRALYVWLSDGMPWFDDHLLPLFEPDALIVVLDAYHVLGRIRAFATKAHRTAKQKAKTLYAQLATLIVGKKPQCAISTTAPAEPKYPDASGFTDYPAMVIARVRNVALLRTSRVSARDDLADYLESNGHRIDYADYRARGISIGSGPMESFHRTASQARLKIPGARWTTETSQAILNLRLVEIVGKTDRFWDRSDIVDHITHALAA